MGRGRPKKYLSSNDRKTAYIERLKEAEHTQIRVYVPKTVKEAFERLKNEKGVTSRDLLCDMIQLYDEYERIQKAIDKEQQIDTNLLFAAERRRAEK